MKEQFNEIIQSKDLKDISIDLIEKALDNRISSEILREFPVTKTILATINIYSSYTDKIFIKKALNVLCEIGDINWKERVDFILELNDKYESGSEKILMAIDKLETTKKAKVFGKLCRLKARKKINDNDSFFRLTKLIQDSYLEDLFLIIQFHQNNYNEIHEGDYYPLISLGLLYQEPTEQKSIERNHKYTGDDNDYFTAGEPEFIGGEIKFNYFLSNLGETLLKHYYDLFPEKK
ncbi:hypothetical protein Q4595_10370 [Wenyingzhuangia sp. 1_MG-2023]|nr:hypothetical protein [Wenyingzhuangia sp. 1_MG-2023]